MAFDEAAVDTFVDNVISHAASTGLFQRVISHEPKSTPGSRLTYGVWANAIEPLPGASGLQAISGYVVVTGRIYGNMLQRPEDDVDPRMIKAATRLLAAYSSDFNFGATARNIDLLGEFGEKLMAKAGYLTVDSGMYRVVTLTIPVIFNDMWTMTA